VSIDQGRSRRSVRRRGRVLAFQTLFEADLVGHDPLDVLDRVLHHDDDDEVDPSVGIFARHLVEGVLAYREELDRKIAQAAPAWPLVQMPPVDKNLLRLAIFELLFDNQRVPIKAVINEAVDIAKGYGSENTGRFVNGVLGTIVEELGEATHEAGQPPESEEAG